jgi:hypothetical protein
MAKWNEIASKTDKAAQNFYTQLVAERMNAEGDWRDTWVELPKDLYLSFARGTHDRSVSYFFDGFEWRTVIHYVQEGHDTEEKVFLRLPADGEVVEEEAVIQVIAENP